MWGGNYRADIFAKAAAKMGMAPEKEVEAYVKMQKQKVATLQKIGRQLRQQTWPDCKAIPKARQVAVKPGRKMPVPHTYQWSQECKVCLCGECGAYKKRIKARGDVVNCKGQHRLEVIDGTHRLHRGWFSDGTSIVFCTACWLYSVVNRKDLKARCWGHNTNVTVETRLRNCKHPVSCRLFGMCTESVAAPVLAFFFISTSNRASGPGFEDSWIH